MPLERAEEARAAWLERFPAGFEERELGSELELAAYAEDAPRDLTGAYTVEEVASDWEDAWRRFHRPATVGRVWIGPPWERAPGGLVAVSIDPGRAFGTGAHATTRLCIDLLQELGRGSLLDVGCGSGVLAIVAAKLAFGPVIAVDNEAAAVDATSANVIANGVAVEVRAADVLRDPLPRTDAAVANIALDAVEAVAARLDVRALVTSGYFARERPRLTGYRHVDRRTADNWAADRWQRE